MSISSPVWEKISFLDVTRGTQTTHFGVFGYTGSKASIGYTFAPARLGFDDTKLNTGVLHSLTFVLVLYPVGESFVICFRIFQSDGSDLQLLALQVSQSSSACVALAITALAQFSCHSFPPSQQFAPL